MAGIDKMKSQILDEAQALAQTRISEAKAQADEILNQARAEAKKNQESISKKSEADVAAYKERIESSTDLQRRTKILKAKQGEIADVIDQAYASFETMDPQTYFSMMAKLLEKYALPEEGELFFSSADLARMPAGFEEQAKKIAEEKGGSLTLSKEGKQIENGFVLAYGGIEENCTLEAMFDSRRDELSDIVQGILFP